MKINKTDIKDIKYGSYTSDITMRPQIVRRPDPLYNNYYRFFQIDTFDMQYQITDGDQTVVNTVNSFHTGQNVIYNNTNLQRTNSINLVSTEMYTGVEPNGGGTFYTNIEGSGEFYIEFIERETIQQLSSTNFRRTIVTNSYEINGNILNHKKFTLVQEGPKYSDGNYNWQDVSRNETIDAYIQLSENWVLRLNIDEIRKYQQGQYQSGLTDTDMTDYVLFKSKLLSFYANSYSGSKHIKALYKGSDLLYEYNG